MPATAEVTDNLLTIPWHRYASECLSIVNKRGEVVPFKFNAGQIALERQVREKQLEQDKPIRVLILKARQLGFSTMAQGLMIQGTTLNGNRKAQVVAHDKTTSGEIFGIGQGMYARLPEDESIKPSVRYATRAQFLHFAPPERDAWQRGDQWPNSTYRVDTANEVQSGRGITNHYLHLSEAAFWGDLVNKLTSLLNTVPREPGTMVVIESTANGANAFKDRWDAATAGDSEYLAFFWPWWKEPTYSLEFANEHERRAFRVGRGKFSDDEPSLVEQFDLTKEQLHWRRVMIANELSGRIDKFHQEYPATPQEAFVASGRQRFDPQVVSQILIDVDTTDPRSPEEGEGPIQGGFKAGGYRTVDSSRGTGKIDVPKDPIWVPDEEWHGDAWKLWLPRSQDGSPDLSTEDDQRRQFIGGVDVSGGRMADGATESDWHAIQFIDHRNRAQVARYRSHIDPDLLAEQCFLAALWLSGGDMNHGPMIAVEITGGWGLPVVRKLYFDYGYPHIYIRTRLESRNESEDDRLGWSTSVATKPVIESNAEELLRQGIHGIKDRELALELTYYVRNEKGKTGAEEGKHDDLLIAWMIAQQVANEQPLRPDWWMKGGGPNRVAAPKYDIYR